MKAIVKKLLDRVFDYFLYRFLQPELELLKVEHSRLASTSLPTLSLVLADSAGKATACFMAATLAVDGLQSPLATRFLNHPPTPPA